jgi:hypothetical protein
MAIAIVTALVLFVMGAAVNFWVLSKIISRLKYWRNLPSVFVLEYLVIVVMTVPNVKLMYLIPSLLINPLYFIAGIFFALIITVMQMMRTI